jgi:hypothetical protein
VVLALDPPLRRYVRGLQSSPVQSPPCYDGFYGSIDRWRSSDFAAQMQQGKTAQPSSGRRVPAQMWAGGSSVPAQMWAGGSSVPAQMWPGVSPVPAQMWLRHAPASHGQARPAASRFAAEGPRCAAEQAALTRIDGGWKSLTRATRLCRPLLSVLKLTSGYSIYSHQVLTQGTRTGVMSS